MRAFRGQLAAGGLAAARDRPAIRDGVRFELSYRAGRVDSGGRFMGGTATMHLVAHRGWLFAGIGYWTDQAADDPQPGAQVLVKRGPDADREVSQSFPGALRINAMTSIPLGGGRSLLVAEAGSMARRGEGPLVCYVYRDAEDRWEKCEIRDRAPRPFIGAFGFLAEEGRRRVFAGTGAGEIDRAEVGAEGGRTWDPEPECRSPASLQGQPYRRRQGFAVVNGRKNRNSAWILRGLLETSPDGRGRRRRIAGPRRASRFVPAKCTRSACGCSNRDGGSCPPAGKAAP